MVCGSFVNLRNIFISFNLHIHPNQVRLDLVIVVIIVVFDDPLHGTSAVNVISPLVTGHEDLIRPFVELRFKLSGIDKATNTASHAMVDTDAILSQFTNPMIVSPDVGGVVRARAIAKRLNDADLAIIDKRRARANQSEVMNIIGDVSGRDCIIMDDIVDTAGTLNHAASALKAAGASTITAFCTHPVLSGKALEHISTSQLDKIIVSDTIPLSKEAQKCSKIQQVTLSGLLAETILRIDKKQSVSSMFTDDV